MVTLLTRQLERHTLADDADDSREVFKLCGPSPSMEGMRLQGKTAASESDVGFVGCEEDAADPDCPARKRRRSRSIPGCFSPMKSTWTPKPSRVWSAVRRGKTTRSPPGRRAQSESGIIRASPVPRPASMSSSDEQALRALPGLRRSVVLLRSNSQPCMVDETPAGGPQRPRSGGGKKRQRERPSVDFFKMSQSRSSEDLGYADRFSPVRFRSLHEQVFDFSTLPLAMSHKTREEAVVGRESGYGSTDGSSIYWSWNSEVVCENELTLSQVDEK